jgi:hypothetical protein
MICYIVFQFVFGRGGALSLSGPELRPELEDV